ncbi:MAG: hypothetical protein RhofKO_14370 [Rhodothermales bacterium]
MHQASRYRGLRPPIVTCMILWCAATTGLYAQIFTPVALTPGGDPVQYGWGASWIDYDTDGDADLLITNNSLSAAVFHNMLFEQVEPEVFQQVPESTLPQSTNSGQSCADYDNDGDVDCVVADTQNPSTALYLNEAGAFAEASSAVISLSGVRGWSAAWGDYDNDGYLDLVISGGGRRNRLYRNAGAPTYALVEITDGPVVSGVAPYTVPTWSDFDQDGDLDLFIGAGPASGQLGKDYLYRNLLTEMGAASFERITEAENSIASAARDGQQFSWVDYDNDGDLDAYITSWRNAGGFRGHPNELYRNDGNGTFTLMTNSVLGQGAQSSLGSAWADFDNDGDLDVYVANDNAGFSFSDHGNDRFYLNNGDGSFQLREDLGLGTDRTNNASAAVADYDEDGDLDLYVTSIQPGLSTAGRLYRNDLASGNHWMRLQLVGITSNRSAIGAKVWVKATIFGRSYWQLREVSSQNTFNGQHELTVHVGLGDAARIDSIRVEWPSQRIDEAASVAVDQRVVWTEGDGSPGIRVGAEPARDEVPAAMTLTAAYPNPFRHTMAFTYALPSAMTVRVAVYNAKGQQVRVLRNGVQMAGRHEVVWDGRGEGGQRLSGGTYVYVLHTESARLVRLVVYIP